MFKQRAHYASMNYETDPKSFAESQLPFNMTHSTQKDFKKIISDANQT